MLDTERLKVALQSSLTPSVAKDFGIEPICTRPVPLIAIKCADGFAVARQLNDYFIKVSFAYDRQLFGYPYARGVAFERLPHILSHGCDVSPSNSVIWVDCIEKATEYGPVIQLFRTDHLEQTFREVPSTTAAEELARLRATYPTLLKSRDGTKFWLSRLSEDHGYCGQEPEIAYARYIPGDTWKALLALLVVVPNDEVHTQLTAALAECVDPKWE